MTRRNLKLVPQADPEPVTGVHIIDLMRAEARQRDWPRIHVEGDKRPPIVWWPRKWRWS